MRLDEAIEVVEVRMVSKPLLGEHKVYGALKIILEAGKRELKFRPTKGPRDFDLLPGETAE